MIWHQLVLEKIVEFFKGFPLLKEDNVFFLGDMYDSALNCQGKTAKYINDIVLNLADRCNMVYIITGNHDLIKHYSYIENHNYRALDSLKVRDNIKIIEEPECITTANSKYLCLPHINKTSNIIEYYKNFDFSNMPETDYVLTHFAIGKDIPFTESLPEELVTNHLKSKNFYCGHIHNSVNSHYPGSIYPCNRKQEGDRFYAIIGSDNEVKHVSLPKFVIFKTINYGEIPEKTDDLTVYYVNIKDKMDMSIYDGYHIASIKFTQEEENLEDSEGSLFEERSKLNTDLLLGKIINTISFRSDKRSLEKTCRDLLS